MALCHPAETLGGCGYSAHDGLQALVRADLRLSACRVLRLAVIVRELRRYHQDAGFTAGLGYAG